MEDAVVFSQIVTDNLKTPMVTRQQDVEFNGFSMRLQTEEALTVPGSERVSWFVMSEQTGPRVVANSGKKVTHNAKKLGFDASASEGGDLFFFSAMQTTHGGNTAAIRIESMNREQAKVYIQEEQSLDEEFRHVKEEVGYMVLWYTPVPAPVLPDEPAPPVFETDGFLEWGDITIDHTETVVQMTHTFINPVVIMGTLSFNGGHPSTVRVYDVTPTSFKVRIQEWVYLDVWHTTESISWLVAEAGHHHLEDGNFYEAGMSNVGGKWNCINFVANMDDPVMFS